MYQKLLSKDHQKNVQYQFIHQDQDLLLVKKGADIEKIKKNIMKITDSDVNVNIQRNQKT